MMHWTVSSLYICLYHLTSTLPHCCLRNWYSHHYIGSSSFRWHRTLDTSHNTYYPATICNDAIKYTLTNDHLGESTNCSTVPYTLRGMLWAKSPDSRYVIATNYTLHGHVSWLSTTWSTSPSGGVIWRILSCSNSDKLTHSWNLQSSKTTLLCAWGRKNC